MKTRAFRKPESYEAERVTRDMLREFLLNRGFSEVIDERKGHGQTIAATAPNGARLVMRVRLCWVRETGHRDLPKMRTYSAAQLLANIKDDDWEGTIRKKIERESSQGVTHFLFVQRESRHIVYAALIPATELLAIWCAQRDVSASLIAQGKLGRRKKNHAMNGSSPTLHLQSDQAPQVAAALWDHAGVTDLAKLVPIRIRLADDEADPHLPNSDPSYSPEEDDRREIVERQIRERRGQQQFRDALRERYGNRCMVTGCNILAVLEAAHIKPYRGESDNHPANGLLLRADIHTLFDLDLLGIEPDQLRVELHPRLAEDDGYGTLMGIALACAPENRPSREALKLRYEHFQTRSHESAEEFSVPNPYHDMDIEEAFETITLMDSEGNVVWDGGPTALSPLT